MYVFCTNMISSNNVGVSSGKHANYPQPFKLKSKKCLRLLLLLFFIFLLLFYVDCSFVCAFIT